ncbi:MAG: fatty acid desaturase, partial [Pseudomonadota bacterium]|nr:fatty acid desaturase [Pseudomonadota bacterium]
MDETGIAPRDASASADMTKTGRSARPWRRLVAAYAKPDARQGVVQLLNTAPPFLALMAVMLWALDHGIVAAILLTPVGAALLVRLFAIQHDCGHNSFFPARWANDLLGRLLGVLTFTPYTYWHRKHAIHHATSGNLDRRGMGDVITVTVREYLALSKRQRLVYRLYRHPVVM